MVKRALLVDVDEVAWSAGLYGLEADIPKSDQIFYIVKNFIGCSDLFREFALMYHLATAKEGEDQHLPE